MNRFRYALVIVALVVSPTYANVVDLSIYEVQYTTDAGGVSPYNEQTHNVLGGIVTHVKPWGNKPRVYIQDPAYPAWAGILVKDWTGGDLAHNVSVGDRINLGNVFIEEAGGTTTLQYGGFLAPDASFTPLGPAAVPNPITLTTAELPAPVYDPVGNTWFVEDHDSEPYEGMLVTLMYVDVGTLGLGKAQDNYELRQGDDVAWAADFMNWDAQGLYHPYIYAGARLERISGIVEQYVGTDDAGTQWDYCQLFTRTTADIVPAVAMDIKPGSCPNPLNRNSHGVLPVALVGAEYFDVTMVDVPTVRLSRADGVGGEVAPNEGPPGPHSVFDDVATPFEGEPCDCHYLGGDGIIDLSMKFRTDDVVEILELNDLSMGDEVELIIMGLLTDGTEFMSAGDCILIVPLGISNLIVTSSVPGAFVEVSPANLCNVDDSGFADFQRAYGSGTAVTLTAPETLNDLVFSGWEIDGAPVPSVSGTTSVTLIESYTTAEAVYVPVSRLPAPTPTPTPRPAPRPAVR